jgi:hypothetical protein
MYCGMLQHDWGGEEVEVEVEVGGGGRCCSQHTNGNWWARGQGWCARDDDDACMRQPLESCC